MSSTPPHPNSSSSNPFAWLQSAVDSALDRLQPPPWMVQEVHQRIVLVLNHVLQQEPEAMVRLKRQVGRVARLGWRHFSLKLRVTPAGLLDVADDAMPADLTLQVTEPSAPKLAQALAQGNKPPVRIEGDVQFAAELNWLIDHVRWDVEEDLSKIVGDVAAHRLCQAGSLLGKGLKGFVATVSGGVSGVADQVAEKMAQRQAEKSSDRSAATPPTSHPPAGSPADAGGKPGP